MPAATEEEWVDETGSASVGFAGPGTLHSFNPQVADRVAATFISGPGDRKTVCRANTARVQDGTLYSCPDGDREYAIRHDLRVEALLRRMLKEAGIPAEWVDATRFYAGDLGLPNAIACRCLDQAGAVVPLIAFDTEFFQMLDDAQVRGVALHEFCHNSFASTGDDGQHALARTLAVECRDQGRRCDQFFAASRREELHADLCPAYAARRLGPDERAGIDFHGLVRYFEQERAASAPCGATHPCHDERIANLERELRATGVRRYTDRRRSIADQVLALVSGR